MGNSSSHSDSIDITTDDNNAIKLANDIDVSKISEANYNEFIAMYETSEEKLCINPTTNTSTQTLYTEFTRKYDETFVKNSNQRLYYLHPDTISGKEPEQQVILHDIENLTFRFWGDDWVSSWNSSSEIPTGIEITITSKHYGELRRVFILPNSVVGD